MRLTFHPAKNSRNLRLHGVGLYAVHGLDFSTAWVATNVHAAPAEMHYQVLGRIGAALHMLVFTRKRECLHAISLRPANGRERSRYDEVQKAD